MAESRAESRVKGGVGAAIPHDSGHLHVSGEATYTDDIPEVRGTLYAAIGMSERSHARIKAIDLTKVRAAPGVVAVITARDIPPFDTFESRRRRGVDPVPRRSGRTNRDGAQATVVDSPPSPARRQQRVVQGVCAGAGL